MFPIDYHNHTSCTRDATSTVDEYCRRAVELGMKEIAISNHLMLRKFDSIPGVPQAELESISIRPDKIQDLVDEIERARKQFGIKVRLSMEIDYFEEKEREIDRIIQQFPFDFVLGSAHFVGGHVVGDGNSAPLLFKSMTPLQVYKEYFSNVEKAAESQLFDVMAHLDVVRKFSPQFGDIPFERYEDDAKAVVESIAENDVGIEMNTYGYKHPIGDSYPSFKLLLLCKRMGIDVVTIGSDSHSPSNLGSDLDKGVEKLVKAGYDSICLFERRKPTKMKIC